MIKKKTIYLKFCENLKMNDRMNDFKMIVLGFSIVNFRCSISADCRLLSGLQRDQSFSDFFNQLIFINQSLLAFNRSLHHIIHLHDKQDTAGGASKLC